MIDKNGKIRLSNSRSMEQLELGSSSPEQTKTRLNVTVLPKTSSWLKGQGNASQTIDELVAVAIAGNLKIADQPSQKLEQLTRENEELKAELNQLQSQLQEESEKNHDYQVIRDKVLSSLKMGRQAAGYRSALKALDRFIAEMQ